MELGFDKGWGNHLDTLHAARVLSGERRDHGCAVDAER
jgi:hypothetical protein